MTRTVTREQQSIAPRGHGDNMTFYNLADTPKPLYGVRVYIEPGSTVDVPPHFHLDHDEIFSIEQGELQITLNGVAKIYDASSGECVIPRGTIHSISGKAPADSPIISWERTEPADDQKEVMFRNMFSTMLDSPLYRQTGKLRFRDNLQLLVTMYEYDGYIAFLPVWTGEVGKQIDKVICGALVWAAKLVGYQYSYPEYVAKELEDAVKKYKKSL